MVCCALSGWAEDLHTGECGINELVNSNQMRDFVQHEADMLRADLQDLPPTLNVVGANSQAAASSKAGTATPRGMNTSPLRCAMAFKGR